MIDICPDRDAFTEAYEAERAQLVWARIADDILTPVGALLRLGRDRRDTLLLESVEGGNYRGRYSAIGLDPDLLWRVVGEEAQVCTGDDVQARAFKPDPRPPLASLRALIADSALTPPPDAPPMAAGLFGYLGYEMVGFVETIALDKPDPVGVPSALLMRPRVVIVFDAVKHDLLIYTPVRPEAGIEAEAAYEEARVRLLTIADELSSVGKPWTPGTALQPQPPKPNMPADTYRAMVTAVKEYIRAGDIFQTVPAQRFSAPFQLPPFALYRSLRRLNPSPFLYYFNFGDFAVIGSSPEILVRLKDYKVTIRPIAGTRPRGATVAEDLANERDLLADPKERAEHLMLLDLGRNDAGRVAEPGSVTVTHQFAIERYSHVMHIVSNVEARLRQDLTAVDALFAGFPAGTVSGAPKVRAMEIIAEQEPERRGVYSGGVGYFSADGNMDMCIALRTGVVKDDMLHVSAGGGVVFDSDPEFERQETEHKSAAVFRAADDAGKFV